jgi:hypothetical protein
MKYEWMIILLAGIITYFLLKKLLNNKPFQKEFLDAIFNVVIIGFLVYKFSFILFRPSAFWENPVSILYFTGGSKGFILALVIGFLYMAWMIKKRTWSLIEFTEGTVYSILTFAVSFWLVRTLLLLLSI